ncbi:MAG: restriction endonuclease, partial [Deltaproteobacteria bacterium]|nr:restriction endonuclease [Deltaproteobacteria bacterium]
DAMKLETVEHEERENQIDIIAKNPTPFTGGLLLIRGLLIPSKGIVGLPQILEFSNVVREERLMKGIFVTTGSFSPELGTLAELAPIEFIDGKKLGELREKFHLY